MRRIDVERVNSVILRSEKIPLEHRRAICREILDWFEREKRRFEGPRRRGERLFNKAQQRSPR